MKMEEVRIASSTNNYFVADELGILTHDTSVQIMLQIEEEYFKGDEDTHRCNGKKLKIQMKVT